MLALINRLKIKSLCSYQRQQTCALFLARSVGCFSQRASFSSLWYLILLASFALLLIFSGIRVLGSEIILIVILKFASIRLNGVFQKHLKARIPLSQVQHKFKGWKYWLKLTQWVPCTGLPHDYLCSHKQRGKSAVRKGNSILITTRGFCRCQKCHG